MKQLRIFVILTISVFIFACSSSQETSNADSEEQEIYVFDDIENEEAPLPEPVNDPIETPVASSVKYIVQIGAFTTDERAQEFVAEKSGDTQHTMSIKFSNAVNLFVVQLPPFDTRDQAENVRNELWATKKFEDAFILTVK